MVKVMLVNSRTVMAAFPEHLAETGAACRMVGKCSCQTEQRL